MVNNNIRNDLRRLFKESIRKNSIRKESNVSPMYRGSYTNYAQSIDFPKTTRIYFYEWSNVCSVPRTFYELNFFITFLSSCNISLQLFEREIIENLGTVYISCYRNTKDLCIRGSYKALLDSINNDNRATVQVPTVQYSI